MGEHRQTEEKNVIRSVQSNFQNEENIFFKTGKTTQGLGSKPLI